MADSPPNVCRAFWITEVNRGEIREEPMPRPGSGQVLVQTDFTGISRGTEALVFRGGVPPSEFERMRAPLQRGSFEFPLNYGYSNVGTVRQGPDELVGKSVFALAPHSTHFVAPATAVVPLPANVPPPRAVLAANMETALNGVWDCRPGVGDGVTVIGAGAVGCLLAYLLTGSRGADVELCDVDDRKAEVASAMGARFVSPSSAMKERDIVINTSGAKEGLRCALELAANQATVVEMSWYGDEQVTLPLGRAFHSRRLQLVSSQVGQVSPNKRGAWTHRRRLELALELLSDPVLDSLITGNESFEELPRVMKQLATSDASSASTHAPVLCQRIYYSASMD